MCRPRGLAFQSVREDTDKWCEDLTGMGAPSDCPIIKIKASAPTCILSQEVLAKGGVAAAEAGATAAATCPEVQARPEEAKKAMVNAMASIASQQSRGIVHRILG